MQLKTIFQPPLPPPPPPKFLKKIEIQSEIKNITVKHKIEYFETQSEI